MPNRQHLYLLQQGVDGWNEWRKHNLHVKPDLSSARLAGTNLRGVNLSETNLRKAVLRKACLVQADLRSALLGQATLLRADLSGAVCTKASFSNANLRGAILNGATCNETELTGVDFSGATLIGATLSGADLGGADLTRTILIKVNLSGANLTRCAIYGISAWDVDLQRAIQSNLVITEKHEPTITVDNLKIAQFVYLLLNNPEIRDIIDTITSKMVLILGRFTPERELVLDTLRDEFRRRNYSPVLCDFEKPTSRDLTETVSTLAHLARFIIVDLTDSSSAPHEVATIIPQCVVPVQPLLLQDDTHPRQEYTMFEDLRRRYRWVLPTVGYQDTADLLALLKESIIDSAEQKAKELAR
jgi:uncharacterized protein YjbI with pentapeptide repeats